MKPQCHPTCYECIGEKKTQCTACPVGYKIDVKGKRGEGKCIKDDICSNDSETCATYYSKCPAGFTNNLDNIFASPASVELCCIE